jgi:hypothetical protein
MLLLFSIKLSISFFHCSTWHKSQSSIYCTKIFIKRFEYFDGTWKHWHTNWDEKKKSLFFYSPIKVVWWLSTRIIFYFFILLIRCYDGTSRARFLLDWLVISTTNMWHIYTYKKIVEKQEKVIFQEANSTSLSSPFFFFSAFSLHANNFLKTTWSAFLEEKINFNGKFMNLKS